MINFLLILYNYFVKIKSLFLTKLHFNLIKYTLLQVDKLMFLHKIFLDKPLSNFFIKIRDCY
jgi:hypothetical protein